MDSGNQAPEEDAKIRESWFIDPEVLEQRLVDSLAARGVDTSGLNWLSSEETDSVIQHWMNLGAQRYGRLALIPGAEDNVHRGEFDNGELPAWLNTGPWVREIFISFSHPAGGRRRIARSTFGFVIDNLFSLARADGDGFGAVTASLEGVLLVNVSEDPDSPLEIDAWGDFVRND